MDPRDAYIPQVTRNGLSSTFLPVPSHTRGVAVLRSKPKKGALAVGVEQPRAANTPVLRRCAALSAVSLSRRSLWPVALGVGPHNYNFWFEMWFWFGM